MIISHRKKFAFFASQKTGSKAAGIILRLSGVFDSRDIMIAQPMPSTRTVEMAFPEYNLGEGHDSYEVCHYTPQKAIDAGYITLEQLREYNCFAYLREPEERYKATRLAMLINYRGVVMKQGKRRIQHPAPPQHEFFFVGDEQVVTPLNFAKFDSELKRMLFHIDGIFRHFDYPEILRYNEFNNPNSPAYRYKYDPQQHKRDIEFYKAQRWNNESNF